MRILYIVLCSVFLFSNLSSAQAVQAFKSDSLVTEVILIGTIHDLHNSNPYYSTQELNRILLALKPDVLLIEIPENQMGQDGRVREQDRVGPELVTTDQVATELRIPQIPFDHPNRNEKNTPLFSRWQELQPRFAQLDRDVKLKKDSLDLQFIRLYNVTKLDYAHAAPTVINSDMHDVLASIQNALNQEVLLFIAQKYPGYDDLVALLRYARDWWNERNTVMVENIMKVAKVYSGKRLVVQTGSSHRYILRDLLKKQQGIVLKEFWEVLKP